MSPTTKKPKPTKAKRKPSKGQVKQGRPSKYTDEMAVELCALISEGGTLESIAERAGVGSRTILYWLKEHADFLRMYTRARDEQGDHYADKVVSIVGRVIDPETPKHLKLDANSARVAIDALKWSAAKRSPRKYGDRIATELTGAIKVEEKPTDTLATARWIADILTSGGQVAALQRKGDDDEDGDKRVH